MGRTPKQSLRSGLMVSSKAWTALVDGLPEAMFGVVVDSVLDGHGTPWFLGSDEVYRHARELLLWGPGLVARMHDSSPRLSNIVSAENGAAIRLLRRWGFTIEEGVMDVRGVPFRHFRKVLA